MTDIIRSRAVCFSGKKSREDFARKYARVRNVERCIVFLADSKNRNFVAIDINANRHPGNFKRQERDIRLRAAFKTKKRHRKFPHKGSYQNISRTYTHGSVAGASSYVSTVDPFLLLLVLVGPDPGVVVLVVLGGGPVGVGLVRVRLRAVLGLLEDIQINTKIHIENNLFSPCSRSCRSTSRSSSCSYWSRRPPCSCSCRSRRSRKSTKKSHSKVK